MALATLGDMTIGISQDAGQDLLGRLSGQMQMSLDISHPSHSGLQMDQITLLFIPMRYVDDVKVDLDGQNYVDVTGSISLSENPELKLSIPSATRSIDVQLTDTDGTVTTASRRLADF